MSSPTPPPSSPTSQRSPNSHNRGTMLPWNSDIGGPDTWAYRMRTLASTPDAAYRMAYEVERLYPANEEVGYRLYAVREGGVIGARSLTINIENDTNHAHTILGRHSSCQFPIEDPHGVISLRHVIVRVSALDDGLPLLNVLDLDSGLGFELSDHSRQHAIVASGPIVFRIGTVWIVAMPINGNVPDALPPPFIRHVHSEGNNKPAAVTNAPHAPAEPFQTGVLLKLVPQPPPSPAPRRVARTSEISILPKSVRLSQTTGNHMLAGGQGVAAGAFAMILSTNNQSAGLLLSEQDVTYGVLVGRDERCVDAGVRAILDIGVSRVHGLIIRERRGIVLYDIASLNGISDGVRRVKSLVLEDQGTEAFLMSKTRIHMKWRALR